MKVHILGVGGGLTRQYHHTSFVIEADGMHTLVECPGEMPRKLKQAGLPITDINHVVITHLHSDHAGGIQDLIWQKTFPEGGWEHGPKLHVHSIFEVLTGRPTPYGFQEGLWGALAPAMHVWRDPRTGEWLKTGKERYYIEHELDEGRAWQSVNNLEARIRRTKHVIPTMAVKFRHGKRVLGYSADTVFDRRLIRWLSDCDLILHETGYEIHADPAKLAALPKPLKRKMLLIHYPDGFPESADGKAIGIPFAREGKAYTV